MRLAYLFSRYPAVSHTFCDTEMLGHERAGQELEIHVVRPPKTSFRHGHAQELQASIHHLPPPPVLRALEAKARREGNYPTALVQEHTDRFGPEFKTPQRARNALWLAETLRRRGVEWMHVHFANRAAHTALFVQALSGLPFSVTAHGQDFMADLGHPELLRTICNAAAFIVVVSDYSRRLLERACPAAREKIFRIHNGVDLRKFTVQPAPVEGPPLILSVGRLVPVKGHRFLIEACAELRQAGLAFRCEVVGDGPERPRLQELIDEHELSGVVQLVGSLPQEALAARFAACTVFALPSIVDAHGATDILPTVVLEAMASGRAVVASEVGGLPELVVPGETGSLVPEKDAAALAQALAGLLSDPAKAASMGAAARIKAEAEFDVALSTARLRELFQRHAPPREARPPPVSPAGGVAYLVGTWAEPLAAKRTEWQAIHAAQPETRLIVARVPLSYTGSREDEAIFAAAEFVPDGMVLEAEWQEQRELAREMELWRNGLSIDGDEFLTQARWALYLRKFIAASGIRHLHIAGAEALPCGWMLSRLCDLTVSATVEATTDRPFSLLQQLTANCTTVRTRHPELSASLAARAEDEFMEPRRRFLHLGQGTAPKLRAWAERLQAFATL